MIFLLSLSVNELLCLLMKINLLIERLNELKKKGVKEVKVEDGNYFEYGIVEIGDDGLIWIESE